MAGKETDVLLKRAGMGVYRTNPFWVLRLPANASITQIQRRVQELHIQSKLGIQQPSENPLISQGIIDDADLQRLVHRLHDPVERLADELLWFWSAADNDDVLTALWRGEIGNAIALWQSEEDAVARHNLALIYHLLALELELRGKQQVERKQWEAYWRQAWEHWQEAIDDDSVWDYLGKRVDELNDPRVDQETVDAFREAMPLFLALINAQLALQASKEGNNEICTFHLSLLREFSVGETYETALTHVTKPLVEEMQILLQTARQKAKEQPPAEVAEWLINSVYRPLKVLDEVFPTYPEFLRLRDELALQIRGWANASIVAGDAASLHKAVWLLDCAIALASTERVREQLKEEVKEGKRALELTPILDRLATLLKEAKDKVERGGYWLMNDAERLLNEAEPLLSQLDRLLSDSPDHQELRTRCHDAVATTTHALVGGAIKAGNRDWQRARELLKRAISIAVSEEVINFLRGELSTLELAIARQPGCLEQIVLSIGSRIIGILVLALIIWLFSTVHDWWRKRSTTRQPMGPTTMSMHSSSPIIDSEEQMEGGRTLQKALTAPLIISEEQKKREEARKRRLERLRQRVGQLRTELEQKKKQLDQLINRISSMDAQITALRREIETLRSQIQAIERAYPLGFPSESELESYRELVRRHNELVNQHNNLAKQRNTLAKQGRALVENLRQKAIEHDQLVVEYNSLLQSE